MRQETDGVLLESYLIYEPEHQATWFKEDKPLLGALDFDEKYQVLFQEWWIVVWNDYILFILLILVYNIISSKIYWSLSWSVEVTGHTALWQFDICHKKMPAIILLRSGISMVKKPIMLDFPWKTKTHHKSKSEKYYDILIANCINYPPNLFS